MQKHQAFSLIFTLALCFPFIRCRGQFYNMPQEHAFSYHVEKVLAAPDSAIHTGFKPYVFFFSPKYAHTGDPHRIIKYIHDDPGIDAVFNKHLVEISPRGADFSLRLDPVLNLEAGADLAAPVRKRLYNNTRGFMGSGRIGDRFYFETMFAENQSFFPSWIDAYAKNAGVVPGQGRWKAFKTTGYDYAFSSGFISVQLHRNINLQAGHGKHKTGHGYRSLLLSDNAFNYPYARITQQWLKGRLQYHNLYAVLMNLVPSTHYVSPHSERLFQKKAAAFQYLSVNLHRSVNAGLFQGMIWQQGDSLNRHRITAAYMNPVIFANAAAFGMDHTNNIVTGADLRIKLTGKLSIYGQYMLDGARSRTGFQTGFAWFDALAVKNLLLQCEYNSVNPGSYRDPTPARTGQSYSHYGQSLAFTPGEGNEIVVIANYRNRRMFVCGRYHYLERGGSRAYSFTDHVNASLGYVINPAYNLSISAGYIYRNENFSNISTQDTESGYIHLALRTGIYNVYYDF